MSQSLVGRKITYVKLHGGDAFVPDVGGLGTTLPPTSKNLDMRMEHVEAGVFVSCKGKFTRKEFVIPWANIQLADYAPEDKPKAS